MTPNPHTLPTAGGQPHTRAPQAPWPDLGTGTCLGLAPAARVACRSWVSPLPTETQVGGRGGSVGTWTSAPGGAGEKPMEQRRQPLWQISFQIQRSKGDRAVSTLHPHRKHGSPGERGRLAPPSCWLHPGALSNDRAPQSSHHPSLASRLREDLTD